ncbi:MAG: tyrosine-type recombinase/integrase, partial [Rhodospirillaceae bacterium]|nr:tyrosine-type recombinase/integrase [Rhodospirillaceae bacterium]
WVIPGTKPGARLSSLFEPWRKVRARAGLDDVRLHDLRHSFASRALALGESLPVIAKLLGHARIQTTARYTHLTRDAVKDAATRVAKGIAEDILPPERPIQPPAAARRNARIARDSSRGRGDRIHPLIVKASMKASAARVAAGIGADILPSRTCRNGLMPLERAAGAAAWAP